MRVCCVRRIAAEISGTEGSTRRTVGPHRRRSDAPHERTGRYRPQIRCGCRARVPGVAEMTFDAIILGAGQAGPPLAFKLANAGQNVALVERKYFGGTCVNTGCIPTKTLIAN